MSVADGICGSTTCLDLINTSSGSGSSGSSGSGDGSGGKWKFPMKEFESSIIEGHTKMMIMNYPHNPTGALLSLSEQAQIIAICR